MCSSSCPFVTYYQRQNLLPYFHIWYRRSLEKFSSNHEFRKYWTSDPYTSLKDVNDFVPKIYLFLNQFLAKFYTKCFHAVSLNTCEFDKNLWRENFLKFLPRYFVHYSFYSENIRHMKCPRNLNTVPCIL
jgi:hypothetical protein